MTIPSSRAVLVRYDEVFPQGFAALAQSAERLTRNEKVAGSIPAGGSG